MFSLKKKNHICHIMYYNLNINSKSNSQTNITDTDTHLEHPDLKQWRQHWPTLSDGQMVCVELARKAEFLFALKCKWK